MSPFTKFRTCFITLILLLGSLSVFIFSNQIVKAESSTTNTTLYFHNKILEDEDLVYLISEYNFEKLMDLFGDIDESAWDDEDLLDYLESMLSTAGASRLMDQNQPTKNNDSEYPPTLKTIINECIKGNWEILEDVLVSSFAPFQGVYVYDGDEPIEINGDAKFNLYFSAPMWYIWNKDTVNVTFTVLKKTDDPDYGEILKSKFTKSQTFNVRRKLLSPLNNPMEYEIPISVNTILEPGEIILAEINITGGEKLFVNYLDLNMSDINQSLVKLSEALNGTGIKFLSNLSATLLNITDILGEDFADIPLSEIVQKLSSSFIYDSIEHKSSLTIPGRIEGEDENIKTYYLHDANMSEELPTNDKAAQLNLEDSKTWESPAFIRSKVLKGATASLYIDHLDLIRLLNLIKGKIKVTATILYENSIIASSSIELGRTTLFDLLKKPDKPMIFDFGNITNNEIAYGKKLSFQVDANETNFGSH